MKSRNTIVILALLRKTHAQTSSICSGAADSSFVVIPGSGCKQYVQCLNQEASAQLTCAGDTIFDSVGQYCNWATSVNCVEPEETAPDTTDTLVESTETDEDSSAVEKSVDCPTPCYGKNGFVGLPGTECKEYVQCTDGKQMSDIMTCSTGTIFYQAGGYCEWTSSTTCEESPCIEEPIPTSAPEPTDAPTVKPTSEVTVVSPSPSIAGEAAAASNETDTSSTGDVSTNSTTVSSGSNTTTNGNDDTGVIIIEDDRVTVNCSMPCLPGSIGFFVRHKTNCSKYVQCNGEEIVEEFECPTGTIFLSDGCKIVDNSTSLVYLVRDQECPDVICSDGTDNTNNGDNINSPLPSASSPTTSVTTDMMPDTQNPTTQPLPTQSPLRKPSTYEVMRKYLFQRKDIMDSIVFQSQYGPSEEYAHIDMMNALNVAVYQLPISLAFFNGANSELAGINYGLVNLAAMLANAMVEGIKNDSCDEWNTDDIDGKNWKFPLSNSCGQYGRMYQRETCREDVDSMCPIINSMNTTALSGPSTHGPNLKGPPPFTCGPKPKDTHIGYYDSMTDAIVPSAFANSLGRTGVEGCCWWGRGALFTRGRCTMSKLNKYLGKQAADEGYNAPYRYIDFCQDPGAICSSYLSRELRWTLAFLEWADEVQSYEHIDYMTEKITWTYWDRLEKFVDGGMVDNQFFDQIVNILVRKCHDGTCNDNEIPFEEERKNNFRRIIGEVFNLPLNENMVDIETRRPSNLPTSRPTKKRKQEQILALPPSSSKRLASVCSLLVTAASVIHLFSMH